MRPRSRRHAPPPRGGPLNARGGGGSLAYPPGPLREAATRSPCTGRVFPYHVPAAAPDAARHGGTHPRRHRRQRALRAPRPLGRRAGAARDAPRRPLRRVRDPPPRRHAARLPSPPPAPALPAPPPASLPRPPRPGEETPPPNGPCPVP